MKNVAWRATSHNRRISGYGLSPFTQIGSLRSPTSDMRQPLSEIAGDGLNK